MVLCRNLLYFFSVLVSPSKLLFLFILTPFCGMHYQLLLATGLPFSFSFCAGQTSSLASFGLCCWHLGLDNVLG